MRVGNILIKMIFWVVLHFSGFLYSQPDRNSKMSIYGIHVFQDNTDPLLFYYEPGALALARNGNGKPEFQFLDMRYTGSKCYNDQGEKNFMSLVQFAVEMKQTEPSTLKKIKSALQPTANLVPLPITHIKTQLIINSIDDNKENIMEKEGALEATGKESYTTPRAFWTKRNFVVKLNIHESQVLTDQLRNGRLGLSLASTYYADFAKKEDLEASGSKQLLESLSKLDTNIRDVIENRVLRSDALAVGIDVNKYPDTIKQLDLNEELPPAYAGTEIRCYDFKNYLRPDLYMKIVEIEAESVSNGKTVSIQAKFLRKHSDINTKHISFPYAIYVDTHMRYRVTEITTEGEKTVSEWRNKESCSSVIDITTQF